MKSSNVVTQRQNQTRIELHRLAAVLETSLPGLYALGQHPERHYRIRSISKASGGTRTLHIPDPFLKAIQRRILHNILSIHTVSPAATAYVPGGSLLQNAAPHRGKRQVLQLDISDFFDRISFPSVYRSAFSSPFFVPAVGMLLTSLCCLDDVLPQGAPTSPMLANLVMKPFDDSLLHWCAVRNITYTRYCDDLTFSGAFHPGEVTAKVRAFLEHMGFSLNQRKSHHSLYWQRQQVTGMVVNEAIQVPRSYRRQLRQELYYCRRFGVKDHLLHQKKLHSGDKLEEPSYLRSLLGRIEYVLQIHPSDLEMQKNRIWVRQQLL